MPVKRAVCIPLYAGHPVLPRLARPFSPSPPANPSHPRGPAPLHPRQARAALRPPPGRHRPALRRQGQRARAALLGAPHLVVLPVADAPNQHLVPRRCAPASGHVHPGGPGAHGRGHQRLLSGARTAAAAHARTGITPQRAGRRPARHSQRVLAGPRAQGPGRLHAHPARHTGKPSRPRKSPAAVFP
jgi:hypothetical protein